MHAHPLSKVEMAPRRILVVDDSLSALMLVQAVLEAGGFQVQTVRSGAEALEVCPRFLPDLVVLDVLMPGMDGLETCRKLRATLEGATVPILFLTGDTRPELQTEAIAVGGDDLIHKHALQVELMIRVRSLLRVRELQKALAEERDAVLAAKQQQDNLFRFIIHDLKSPLQVIRFSLDLMENVNVDDQGSVWINQMNSCANQMTQMIQDLLDVMQAKEACLVVHKERFLLEPALRTWQSDVMIRMAAKKQTLHMDVPEDLVLVADQELIHRCVVNLMGNAQKYSPSNSQIQISACMKEDGIQVLVEDEGPGVPAELREDIFKPFVRLARDKALQRESSGLGLAFCDLVAQAHGGKIWVEDRAQGGSRFTLLLPAGASGNGHHPQKSSDQMNAAGLSPD